MMHSVLTGICTLLVCSVVSVNGVPSGEFFALPINALGKSLSVLDACRLLCANDPRRGYVAWVSSAAEQQELNAIKPANASNFILGGSRSMGNQSVFRWTEGPMGAVDGGLGTPFFQGINASGHCLMYCNFRTGEPNNYTGLNETFLSMEDGKWNDVQATLRSGSSYCGCRKKNPTESESRSLSDCSVTPNANDGTFFTVPLLKLASEDLMSACRRGCTTNADGPGFVAWVLSARDSLSLWSVVPIGAHRVVLGGSRDVTDNVYRWTEGPMRLFENGQGRSFYVGTRASQGGSCVPGLYCNFDSDQPDDAYGGQSQVVLWGPGEVTPSRRGKWDDTSRNSSENASTSVCACRRPATQSNSPTLSLSNATEEVFALDATSSFTPNDGTFFTVPLERQASDDLMSACRRGCMGGSNGPGFVAWVLTPRDNQSLWSVVPYDAHFVVLGGSREVDGAVYRWTEGPMRVFENGKGRRFYVGAQSNSGGHCVVGMFCNFDTGQPDSAGGGQSQLVLWGPARTPPSRRGKWDDSSPNSFFALFPPSASVCGCRRPPTSTESASSERPSASLTATSKLSTTQSATMSCTQHTGTAEHTLSPSPSNGTSWSTSVTPSLTRTASRTHSTTRSNTSSHTVSWSACREPLRLSLMTWPLQDGGGWPIPTANTSTGEPTPIQLEVHSGPATLRMTVGVATRVPAPPLEVLHAPTGPWTLRTHVQPTDPSDAPDAAVSLTTRCGKWHDAPPSFFNSSTSTVCITTLRVRHNYSSWLGLLTGSTEFAPVLTLQLTALCAVERMPVVLLVDVERTAADRESQVAAAAWAIAAGATGGDLGSASAMLLLSTLSCDDAVQAPLPVTQFLISVFYAHGAVAVAWGNLGLCAAFVCFHAALTKALSLQRGQPFATTAGEVARFPAIGFNVLDFLLPGSVFGAVTAMATARSATSTVAAGAMSLVVVVATLGGLTMWTVRYVLPQARWELYVTYPTAGAWDAQLYPTGRWGPKYIRNAYGPLVTSMVFEFGVLTAAQRVVTAVLAAANALQGHAAVCEAVLLLLSCSYFFLAAILVALRPLRLPMNGCVVPASHCVFGIVCALKYSRWSPDAVSALQTFHAGLQMWRMLWVMWLSYREARWDASTIPEHRGQLVWTMANAVWYGSGGVGEEVEATFIQRAAQQRDAMPTAAARLIKGLADDDADDANILEMTHLDVEPTTGPLEAVEVLSLPPCDIMLHDGSATASHSPSPVESIVDIPVAEDHLKNVAEESATVPLLHESERADAVDVDAEGNMFGIERYFLPPSEPEDVMQCVSTLPEASSVLEEDQRAESTDCSTPPMAYDISTRGRDEQF